MTTYDSIPYPSYAYSQTAPARMKAAAQIFGHKAPDIAKAKVLEIGCASGGNLLSLAELYPNATFVGIDLSAEQIAKAQAAVDALGLKNITFLAESIVTAKFKRQKFDYIIAHGIYSWVPAEVQDRLLQICGEHLSKDGVAYVSYNTLPGWNAVKTIRDMMLYHGENFSDPAQKVREARNMLKFVADNMKAQSGPYKDTLQIEINTLQNASDNYLLHDHLESVNEPCYFHEFMSQANKYGLTYMAESELPTMYLGNQNEVVSGTLSQINDTVRQEQYLDFVNNRRFRMTLLVKEGTKLNRKVSEDVLDGLQLIPRYYLAEAVKDADLGKVEELKLLNQANSDMKGSIKGRVACACYLEILRNLPVALTIDEIADKASKQLGDVTADAVKAEFNGFALRMLFNGMVFVTAPFVPPVTEIAENPKVLATARILGLASEMLPNVRHEAVKMSGDQRLLMQYCTGENSREQIASLMKKHVEKGELTINANGKPVVLKDKNFDEVMNQFVLSKLVDLAKQSLLVA